MLRLQQEQMLLRSKLDREDRLSDAIPDELWTAKSAELQEDLRRVRTEMERHEVASDAYEAAGLQILELAQTAYSSLGRTSLRQRIEPIQNFRNLGLYCEANDTQDPVWNESLAILYRSQIQGAGKCGNLWATRASWR